ncbi:peptidoglycan/xylan/chitin deacetylase (PgdA/CDA1 family) [Brevibacterium paucivorans]|uniref:Peptidoglycan/xylan/chitin deacetylase (PgdA/CDA1 family) n=1 Tax=Brevibacterium paucivorans TaxID=170994 RepID=A0ABS2SKB0_9MICO|nr:peptidoglycan/xylan/chitin deacetylase (PgdA/CDA1 family) [Brevibacterium paucivorans]
MLFKKVFASTALVATVLAGGVACTSNVKEERGEQGASTSYDGVPESVKERLQRLAIVKNKEGVSVDAQLVAVNGAASLNEEVEKFALDQLEEGGAFAGKKTFTPAPTPASKQAELETFIREPDEKPEASDDSTAEAGGLTEPNSTSEPEGVTGGATETESTSTTEPTENETTAPGAEETAGAGDTSADSDADVTLRNEIVFAGGKYVVSRIEALVKGEQSVKLLVTDLEADTTVPAKDMFTGETLPSDDDLDDLTFGKDALPSYKDQKKKYEELSDLGKEVADNGSKDVAKLDEDSEEGSGFSCALAACVALTYDDGPGGNDLTDRLIKSYKKHNARATFFVIGKNVKEYPEEVKRMVDAGHEVGNHSYTHPILSKVGAKKADKEIADTDAALEDAGLEKPTLLRPPYGATNRKVDEIAGDYDKRVIMWDVDTLDWKTKSTPKTVAAVKNNVHPGSIVLMHSIHQPTVDATDDILKFLEDQGYSMVTVSELYRGSKFDAGKEYFCKGAHMEMCSTPDHPYVTKNS